MKERDTKRPGPRGTRPAIVGGQPRGGRGEQRVDVPVGVERLLLDAAGDPGYRQALLADREAVLALFDNRIARFKHPKDVWFMEALPRNAMGKVQKYRLRELLSEKN